MAAAVHDAPAPPNVFDKFRKPRSRAESLASGNACTLIDDARMVAHFG